MPSCITRPDLHDPGFAAAWESRAAVSGASAFLSWSWVGCLADERFSDPCLVEAAGSLALFNRRGRSWYLAESGERGLDAVFTEHNGALGPLAPILAAIRPVAGRVVLSGIGDAGLAAVRAAGGIVVGLHTRAAPYASLDPTKAPLEFMSRNARAQLRRSDRSYAAAGPIVAERAETAACALDWLDRLVAWHRATWGGRAIESGFLAPPVQRFHRALVARGVPGGSVDVLRIAAGARVIGYLLNLRAHGRVHAYQSGFDYDSAGLHEKPGLSCHHAAMQRARALGDREYDFLAGDSRYKRSLATASRDLHWLVWKPRPVLFGIELQLRRLLRR